MSLLLFLPYVHMDLPETEPGSPRCEVGDYPPGPYQGLVVGSRSVCLFNMRKWERDNEIVKKGQVPFHAVKV